MKKIILIIALISIAVLSGCGGNGSENPVCSDDQTLVDGVCEDIITCDPGYILEEDECVLIDTTTELERAFEQSIGLSNYQLDITITEATTSVNMILEFDDNISSFTVNDSTEYYLNEDDVCTKYTIQLGQLIEETIDCISLEDTRFKFFHGFEIEWFDETEDGYALKEGNYALLTNFFRNAQSDAIVENFLMTLENDYFHTFEFDVLSEDTLYHFTMTFSRIDDVVITIPE